MAGWARGRQARLGHRTTNLEGVVAGLAAELVERHDSSINLELTLPPRHHGQMQFTKDSLAGIIEGTNTITFRGWKKAQAIAGGRHRIWGHLIEVDDVRIVTTNDITDAEARRAGAISADKVLARLGDKASGPIYRIQFHYVGLDDRIELRNSAALNEERRAEIQARLDRMDRASKDGPWVTKSLRLIATYPGVVSTVLARQLGQDRPAFKINIRKLKELGLTESLEIGYRLSPLGEAFAGVTNENAENAAGGVAPRAQRASVAPSEE